MTEIIVSTEWIEKDGDKRVLAYTVNCFTGNVQAIKFKGKAKDWKNGINN